MEEKGMYLPEKDYPCVNKYTEAQLNTPKRMKNLVRDVHTPEEKRVRLRIDWQILDCFNP